MTKFSLLFAAAAMAASAFAAPSWVMFSSEGPDKYADGSLVEDGEVYALVWTANDAFGGFDAKGSALVAGDKVVGLAAIAKDHKCPPVMYMLVDDNANISGGNFFVYLLDTRKTVSDKDGNITSKVGGVAADGTVSINSYNAVVATAKGESSTAKTGTVEGGVASAVPAEYANVQPVVKAIKVEGAKVYVTVGNTVPCIQYGITAGPTPSDLTQKPLASGVNGVANGDITLIVNDTGDNRFFKVTRQ